MVVCRITWATPVCTSVLLWSIVSSNPFALASPPIRLLTQANSTTSSPAAKASTSVKRPELISGDQGPLVVELQVILQRQGLYYGDVDGVLSGDTETAVKVFQQTKGLAVTGRVDEKTWAALATAQTTKSAEPDAAAKPAQAATDKDATDQSATTKAPAARGVPIVLGLGAIAGLGLGAAGLWFSLSRSAKSSDLDRGDSGNDSGSDNRNPGLSNGLSDLSRIDHPLSPTGGNALQPPPPPGMIHSSDLVPHPAPNLSPNRWATNASLAQTSIPPLTPLDNAPHVGSAARLPRLDIIETLIGDLQNPDPTKRRKAIWELGQRADSRAVQPLVNLMASSDSKQRSLILGALSEIGMQTLKPMKRALAMSLQDTNPEVRKNAIRDLTKIYDLVGQISQLLNYATEDNDLEVRETAHWALNQLNRIRTTATLEPGATAPLLQQSINQAISPPETLSEEVIIQHRNREPEMTN